MMTEKEAYLKFLDPNKLENDKREEKFYDNSLSLFEYNKHNIKNNARLPHY